MSSYMIQSFSPVAKLAAFSKNTGPIDFIEGAKVVNREILNLVQGDGTHNGYITFTNDAGAITAKWDGGLKTMLTKCRQLQQPSIEDLHRLHAGQYKISGQRQGSLGTVAFGRTRGGNALRHPKLPHSLVTCFSC